MLLSRVAALLSALMLLCAPALAQDEAAPVRVARTQTERGFVDSPTAYDAQGEVDPVLTQALCDVGQIPRYLEILTYAGVSVTCRASAYADAYVSVLYQASGRMPQGGRGEAAYAATLGTDGARVTAADVFINPDDAQAFLDAYMTDYVEETLSDYMDNRALTPVPINSFYLTPDGMVFVYQTDMLSFLSGRAGRVFIAYDDLRPILRQDGAAAAIEACRADDFTPYDAVLVQSMDELLAQWLPLYDADAYPGGSCRLVEEAERRGWLLITNDESDTLDALQIMYGRALGFCVGASTRKQWRERLGEPIASVPLSGAAALAYRLPDGVSDQYELSGHAVTLHADEGGVLRAVIIRPMEGSTP